MKPITENTLLSVPIVLIVVSIAVWVSRLSDQTEALREEAKVAREFKDELLRLRYENSMKLYTLEARIVQLERTKGIHEAREKRQSD